MALDDYMEPEVAIAVAVTAAIASPTVRRVLRKGAVFGLAGSMIATDTVAHFGKTTLRGIKDVADSAVDKLHEVRQEAAEPHRRRKPKLIVEGAQ